MIAGSSAATRDALTRRSQQSIIPGARLYRETAVGFFQLIRETFQFEMENLLQIVLVTLAWLALALLVISLPGATLAVYYFARQAWLNGEANLRDFVEGLRRYLWKAWCVVLPCGVLLFVLTYSIAFYLGSEEPAMRLWAGVPMAGFSLLLLLQNYLFVFFVRENGALWIAVKKSYLLCAANVLFSLALMLFALLWFLGLYATRIGLALLFVGPVAVMQTRAVQHLLTTHQVEF